MTTQVFKTIHITGIGVYSAVVVLFAFYVAICRFREGSNTLIALRRFRSFGIVIGLSMGAIFFGGVGLQYAPDGVFIFQVPEFSGLMSLKYLVFLVLWISSFHLEIWTLQGIRSIDPDLNLLPSEIGQDYVAASNRVSNQLICNTGLLFALIYTSIQ